MYILDFSVTFTYISVNQTEEPVKLTKKNPAVMNGRIKFLVLK